MILVQYVIDENGGQCGEGKDIPVSRHAMLRDLWQGLATDGWITQVTTYLIGIHANPVLQ